VLFPPGEGAAPNHFLLFSPDSPLLFVKIFNQRSSPFSFGRFAFSEQTDYTETNANFV